MLSVCVTFRTTSSALTAQAPTRGRRRWRTSSSNTRYICLKKIKIFYGNSGLYNAFVSFPGQAERERVHAAVPLRRLLLLPQAEGAGVQEHCLDLGVRRPEAQGEDRQLHSHILKKI